MSKSKILFKMTGSIACYKACNLISKLVQNEYDVQVVASKSALNFVGTATLEGLTGRKVVSDLWEQGHAMDHINWIRWADLILVAPATANYINKISHGIGDDLLTTLFLAHDFKKPFLIAPAMNTMMYLNPITQESILKLKVLNISVLETASGVLACGENGQGKLLDPDLMFTEIEKNLGIVDFNPTKKIGLKILVTSGGTQEPIDDVRVITNTSTGKTGSNIADELISLGHDVTFVHAKNSALPKQQCKKLSFTTFKDLQKILFSTLKENHLDAVIHLAAVSDFTVDHSNNEATKGKISSESDLTLKLIRNPKLVDQIKEHSDNKELKLIAFKMTSTDSDVKVYESISKLLESSRADLVVHNDVRETHWNNKEHLFHLYKNLESKTDVTGSITLAKHLSLFLQEDRL